MSRLTEKCGDWGYTVPGLNSVVKDNAEIIGEMINKLAEYENLGSVEDFKHLKHELEVYKRALNEAVGEIDLALEGLSDCHMDDWGYENLHTETNYFLDQARNI